MQSMSTRHKSSNRAGTRYRSVFGFALHLGRSDRIVLYFAALQNVRFRGQSGHDADLMRCLLLTQSGHDRVGIAAVQTNP